MLLRVWLWFIVRTQFARLCGERFECTTEPDIHFINAWSWRQHTHTHTERGPCLQQRDTSAGGSKLSGKKRGASTPWANGFWSTTNAGHAQKTGGGVRAGWEVGQEFSLGVYTQFWWLPVMLWCCCFDALFWLSCPSDNNTQINVTFLFMPRVLRPFRFVWSCCVFCRRIFRRLRFFVCVRASNWSSNLSSGLPVFVGCSFARYFRLWCAGKIVQVDCWFARARWSAAGH